MFQVALAVFLSHIGSFVPADTAIIGMTDRYDVKYLENLKFARFLDIDGNQQICPYNDRIFCAMGNKPMTTEQSTFMVDLHQVGMMLR